MCGVNGPSNPIVRNHCEAFGLGFVDGAEVSVVSRVNGDVIVTVKGARLGLNRQMSNHIMVTP